METAAELLYKERRNSLCIEFRRGIQSFSIMRRRRLGYAPALAASLTACTRASHSSGPVLAATLADTWQAQAHEAGLRAYKQAGYVCLKA